MTKKTRKEKSLSVLRRIVRRIYEKNGYEILTWLEGACPDKLEKTRDDAPEPCIVLDLAIDEVARSNGREPNRNPLRNLHCKKKGTKKPAPSRRIMDRSANLR